MLQRPHFPIPHFIRISSEVMMFSFEKPSAKKTGSVNRIMIGGPQISGHGCIRPLAFTKCDEL